MKRSKLFTKTLKTVAADETSRNAELLIRAGYIYKEMAGAYAYLPLGMRTLEKIKQIIREEMNAIGGQELTMTALQSKDEWERSGRWDSEKLDVWFKTALAAGGEVGLAPTHEEPITKMMTAEISSYKDLPVCVYQFQNKFRNELRSKSGIMRTREFVMKDLYSFCKDEATHEEFYEKAAESYHKVFDRLGIGNDTYRTFASGGSFSKFSDEFQTICDVGEDIAYLDREKRIAVNEEVYDDETLADLGLKKENLEKVKVAEVGNIFTLGLRYSEALGLVYNDEDGERKYVYMGSYGIGPSRVMGVIAEKLSDDKGLVWPEAIAPYKYYLVGIGEEGEKKCAEIYQDREEVILWDDRAGVRVGEKFADAELMGIPYRVVISEKTLANNQVEVTERATGETKLLTSEEFINKLS
ncbi:MAG: prolyl-tRNA synthetase [Candidatus Nomurabacteria bacterium]|jgi:prolyl-tRNA synthetase|nr:prolyl-tRNA synthetase [Candidatus Nomurabacteria bacterium]